MLSTSFYFFLTGYSKVLFFFGILSVAAANSSSSQFKCSLDNALDSCCQSPPPFTKTGVSQVSFFFGILGINNLISAAASIASLYALTNYNNYSAW